MARVIGRARSSAWWGRIEILAVTAAALVLRCGRSATSRPSTRSSGPGGYRSSPTRSTNVEPSKASVTGAPNLFGGTLATMPGVPTMWLGSIGRLVWGIGRDVGVVEGRSTFYESRSGLTAAQLSVAVATSLLIGLVVWLVARWAASPRAGLVAGLLLATEPFWVAHGSVIHTDELTSLFGLSGLLALGLVLGVPRVDTRSLHHRWLAVLAGFLLVCSPLTKISGLAFAPGVLLIVVWAAVRAIRSRDPELSAAAALKPLARAFTVVALVAVATVLVLWPAVWADPGTQLDRLRDSVGIGYHDRATFFLGEVRRSSIPTFYAVALPFRMTPWMLAGLVIGVPVALARRSTRASAAILVAAVLPILYTLSTAGQQIDRYGLLVLGPLVVVVGIATTAGARESPRTTSLVRWGVLGAGLLATVHATVVAPWGLAYFNPVLGGGRAAEDNVSVGWQEGQEIASRRMKELERGRCDDVTYNGLNFFLITARECGTWVKDPKKATYVALYVTQRQTMSPAQKRALTKGRELVSVVRIRDIDYVELWRTR